MGERLEQISQIRYTNYQEAHKNMLNIISHQGNTNLNFSKISHLSATKMVAIKKNTN